MKMQERIVAIEEGKTRELTFEDLENIPFADSASNVSSSVANFIGLSTLEELIKYPTPNEMDMIRTNTKMETTGLPPTNENNPETSLSSSVIFGVIMLETVAWS